MMEAKGKVTVSNRDRSRKYLREVRSELKKVVWPTPRQTLSYTGFVVSFSLVVALIISGLDAIFNFGLNFIR
ncbi:MAG: preprotein translocase subunit SecE [Firmicutes bacterium]|nr:preprotein translocase subunit SecE [Bacillota bacterium]